MAHELEGYGNFLQSRSSSEMIPANPFASILQKIQFGFLQHARHFSKTLDFACAERRQNQGF